MTNKLKATKQNFAVALVCCFIIKLQVFLIFYYATEQYFPLITFITLYEVVITFASSVGILSVTILTIQIKATAQFFPVALYIMLYKVFLALRLWIKSLLRIAGAFIENLRSINFLLLALR